MIMHYLKFVRSKVKLKIQKSTVKYFCLKNKQSNSFPQIMLQKIPQIYNMVVGFFLFGSKFLADMKFHLHCFSDFIFWTFNKYEG